MKPYSKRLFKRDNNVLYVNISYACLFSVRNIAKLIYMKLKKNSCKCVCIKGFGLEFKFSKKDSLDDIEGKILKFQEYVAEEACFQIMYFRTSKDIMLELWLDNSKDKHYRIKFIKELHYFYKNNMVNKKTKIKILKRFCGIM